MEKLGVRNDYPETQICISSEHFTNRDRSDNRVERCLRCCSSFG